jgi:basic amino acid/polyamine antiporter, APA family
VEIPPVAGAAGPFESGGGATKRRDGDETLRRRLGLAAVLAVVVGDVIGSGIFFAPGKVAARVEAPWQAFFVWALCGAATLCGALTLGEIATRLPRSGVAYHAIREGFGPAAAFLKIWIETWIGGPGSIAGMAILFGEAACRAFAVAIPAGPVVVGAGAIVFFAAVNLCGVSWGGRTQIVLTTAKLLGVAALVVGGLVLAGPAPAAAVAPARDGGAGLALVGIVGAAVSVVLYTYDGWIDVTHVAGEVRDPDRTLPLGLALGVGAVAAAYLLVNAACFRVVPFAQMRADPDAVSTTVARAAYGSVGARLFDGLVLLSTAGALGGLVLALPRLVYAGACGTAAASPRPPAVLRAVASVSPHTGVPRSAVILCAAAAIVALVTFGRFESLAQFVVVPLQASNVLVIASIFRLRRRANGRGFRVPAYPWVPLAYALVLVALLAAAIAAGPADALAGIGLTATGIPVYFWLQRRTRERSA